MKFSSEKLKLYAITDRKWLNGMELEKAVELAILGGATFVQLREKNIDDNSLLNLALKVKAVTDKYDVPFVINDNVYLAKEIDADGVHVGADDMAVSEARRILGRDKIVGGTARTLERALIACKEGATYLGIGAVFDTSTKSGTTRMTKDLAIKINELVSIPTVAIGGINKENISRLSGYGISGVAVVSSVFNSDDITKSTMELKKEIDKYI
ncbi:MAG: thiamine phosphate synthase [Lachnospirales bacterium]